MSIHGLSWLLPLPPAIELRGVGLSHSGPPPVTALSPVDLTVGHGELVTVTGPAGSGKTTLLNVIGLLGRPTTGRYRLNGIDTALLGDRDAAALRGRQIGFVFQRPQLLLSRSVADNVSLALLYRGLRAQRRQRRAMDMLDRVGIAGLAGALAGQLSAGERQLAAIARALAGGPSLLLCDEPTASLDPGTTDRIIDLLSAVHRDGGTVLIVTRDPLLADCGTRSFGLGADLLADRAMSPGR
ncbi:MAG TPA: ATP-binding cassette domain-containing protein [Streptosporangiaceae bacterium]|nr:ATP-binding cassette domain-containing protein [Streptosporangiaceae bacterium]